ncbi:PREDICTED: uncharacterized protein LOC109347110 [Lupinus angustifolius]|uniref:uncharacterized protein LOC109347110 n=1 Tax=Lupinus angustifolius TaxID=3871 RepID=UPI00092EEFFA|nr:PREDICTED: uncharacterized protein LOC109347110 [Lupinus angustifolius]
MQEVEYLQDCINNNVDDIDIREQEVAAQKNLLKALDMEEIFWKDKARINWTSRIWQVTNSLSLIKERDSLLTNPTEIESHILHYFTSIFGSENFTMQNTLIQSVVPNIVSEEENNMLTKLLTCEEIKKVVFSLNADGAPGPDGFCGSLYQTYWEIVKEEVCKSMIQFFRDSWLLPNMNANNIVLIPKVKGADKIEEYRPVAIANFQFKIISKELADRLAVIASRIVSKEERGFIKGRQIQDCICLAFEATNLLDYKVFGEGVRQGDPLSPQLFCLAEDVLSRGISDLVRSHKLSSISRPKGLQTPSHVLYANDILIFCKGINKELLNLKSLISDYALASGQQINISKSKFYSGKISTRKSSYLADILGFYVGSLPFNYLGVPLF